MKTVFIAAGYATRLYPLTLNRPKPLLEVGGVSLLDRLMGDVDRIGGIDGHIVVCNHKFFPHFEKWRQDKAFRHPVELVDDGTVSNEGRLGAVGDLLLALGQCQVDDDVMVLAADNILTFSLDGFVDFFHRKEASVIMCHHEPEVKRLQRTGVIAVDEEMRVLEMQEKPANPVSHWAVPPFYIYKRNDLPVVRDCLAHGCGSDAPGHLARYLSGIVPMYAWRMPGERFDIGSLDSYREAQHLFGSSI